MALFIVRHQHPVAHCPAQDPYVGATLLNHLRPANAARYNVKIQGEAVVQGEHIMYLIAEAPDAAALGAFLCPFQRAGDVDIHPAATCARVVANGGCGSPPPAGGRSPTLDPEQACQDAIEADLIIHRAHPLNCEAPPTALIGGVIMPTARFYVRNHFPVPKLDPDRYRLRVGGLVNRPMELTMHQLRRCRTQSIVATLECAGNGRTLFDPPIGGEPWALGAVSTAEWTGIPLTEILDRTGVRPQALEVIFRGADEGEVDERGESIRFERSLPLEQARCSGALLAYAMNGEPLPIQHGYPIRLIVPDWYAVASVKWLTDIELVSQPFAGHYQRDKYWYEWHRGDQVAREAVTLQRVRSLITEPTPNSRLPRGELTIRGVAWSGAASIARVEICIGNEWREAELIGERTRHCWQRWELLTRIDSPGPLTVRARASDLAGHIQPEYAEWNALGYGNNSVQRLPIVII